MDSTATIGLMLHDVARLMRKRFDRRAKDFGLTRAQWQTLANLSKNEGIHQAGLAEIMEIEPITLVRIIDNLAKRGLVERRQHPKDRRVWLLHMGEEAEALLVQMRSVGEAARAEALEGVSEADRDHLHQTLTRMKSNLIQACRPAAVDNETHHG